MKPEVTEAEKDAQAIAIALSLGDGQWAMRQAHYTRELMHAEGYGIHLYWRDGRLKVSGVWPKNAAGELMVPSSSRYGDENGNPDISVSAARNAAAIAADIARRFLPVYLPAYQRMMERAASQDTFAATSQATLRALRLANGQPATNGDHHYRKDSVYLKHSHGYSVTVSGDSVRFEAFSCPLDVALAILPLLDKPDTE